MHRFFILAPFAESMQITGQDANHIQRVLRMRVGEELQIVSNDQVSALMTIEDLAEGTVSLRLKEKLAQSQEPSVRLVLAQCLPKGDKMDSIIQKAVELGAAEILPIASANCVVQLDESKSKKKTERWQKIAEAAAKQCKRDIIPRVAPVQSFEQLLSASALLPLKILAYEVEDKKGLRALLREQPEIKELLVLIGPEGGISKDEYRQAVEAGFCSVSLGKRILRTETAGIAVLSAVLYETGDFGG